MTVAVSGGRGVREIETACFGRVEVGASVLFLGRDVRSDEWLLWWGEESGLGGVWCESLEEAWREFMALVGGR
jgi:hypothetical protein